MNTKRFWIGSIVGGIVYFFLGYLMYGILLFDFMKNNGGTATNVDRDMDTFVWWALVAGNIVYAALISYVVGKSNATQIVSGFKIGSVVGFLAAAGIDLIMYATTNITTLNAIGADIAVMTVCSGITGSIIVWVGNLVSAKATSTTTA